MKKVLLATTALVLSAGVAAAEVSVGGKAGIWLQDDGVNDTMVNYDLNIDFSAEGTTDSGLTFGLDFTIIDGQAGTDDDNSQVDNSEVFVSGAFGKLTVGDVDDALQKVAGIGDIGYDGLGVDNVAEQARGDGSANGVLYEYHAGDFGLYLSHNPDTGDDDVAAGVKFSVGDFGIGLGYEDQGAANGDTVALDLSGSFGSAGFDLYYEDSDGLGSGYGMIVDFTTGATTISLGYADHDNAADAAMGIGVSYDLGGATLAGGVADNGTDTVWDLGVSMSF